MTKACLARRDSLAMPGVSTGEVGVGGSVVEGVCIEGREGREQA